MRLTDRSDLLASTRPIRRRHRLGAGFTLLELMIVLAILGILLTVGVPSLTDFLEKGRVKSAAESVSGALTSARLDAVQRNTNVYVQFDGGATWCYGIATQSACDCTINDATNASACVLKATAATDCSATPDNCRLTRATSTQFPKVTMSTTDSDAYQANFDPTRGTTGGGTATLTADSGYEIRVIVSPLGRVRQCSPSGPNKVTGYKDC